MSCIEKEPTILLFLNFALHILMIGIFLSIILKYYIGFSEYEYIWFCSKILTVKKMIKNNNQKDQVFYNLAEGYQRQYIKDLYYLDFLKYTSKEGCLHNYKKCGILDTYGNNFCFLSKYDCPMNDFLFDYTSKLSEYQQKDYKYYPANPDDYYFYYKYGVENKGIILISKWITSESRPKYINGNNFIFDVDAFKEVFEDDDDDDDDDDDFEDDDDDDDNNNEDDEDKIGKAAGKAVIEGSIDFAGSLISNSVKLARIYKLIDYIDEKINKDEKNIDYNYTYINGKNYVKNYMGFKDLENAKDFDKIDFSIYKSRYPNYISMLFAIIFLICYTVFLIIYIVYTCKEKEMNKLFCISIIYYVPSFLGFWLYSIIIYAMYFKSGAIEIAKRIRADKYIEDFLEEFYSHFEKNGFIIAMITLFSFSAVLFISIFLLKPIMNCIIEKERENYYRDQVERIRKQNQDKERNYNMYTGNYHRPQLNTEDIQINTNSNSNRNRNNIIRFYGNTNQNENNAQNNNMNDNNANKDELNNGNNNVFIYNRNLETIAT